jgi:hypothetical protein
MSYTSTNKVSFDAQTKLGKSTLDFCIRNGFDHTKAVKVFKKPTDDRLQKCVKKAFEVQTDPSNDYIAVHGWSILNTKEGKLPTAEWHCVNYSPSIDAKNKAKDWKIGEKILPAWIDTNADVSSFKYIWFIPETRIRLEDILRVVACMKTLYGMSFKGVYHEESQRKLFRIHYGTDYEEHLKQWKEIGYYTIETLLKMHKETEHITVIDV